MKKIFGSWKNVVINYLFQEDLISFYAFFSVIFIECAYLWLFQTKDIVVKFTFLLLAYVVNVVLFSWLKGMNEGNRLEIVFARLYTAGFAVIFLVGSYMNFFLNLILVAIAFSFTFVWILIRQYQNVCATRARGIEGWIRNLFRNKVFWTISQIVVIGLPFITFTCFLVLIPTLPVILKIIITLAYIILMPYTSLLEGAILAQSIFEIAYDIYWNPEIKEIVKVFRDIRIKSSKKRY